MISLRFECDWFMRDSSEPIIDGAKQSHSDPKSVSTLQLKMEMCFELNKCFSWKFLRADECYDYFQVYVYDLNVNKYEPLSEQSGRFNTWRWTTTL